MNSGNNIKEQFSVIIQTAGNKGVTILNPYPANVENMVSS